MEVSVIIPCYNRIICLTRALESVYKQDLQDIEIIIIDDASTDNTSELIKEQQRKVNIPIKYLRNEVSMGAAVSRNQGAKLATGKFVAFLDSDDEWLPNHLTLKITAIKEAGVKGSYGTYFISDGTNISHTSFAGKPKSMSMANYIFSRVGDPRTSTFVFQREAFNKVQFDELLKKHQDWDLSIRFHDVFNLVLDCTPTVIIHVDVDNRMSNSNNHEASCLFYNKYCSVLSEESKSKFYTNLATKTLKFEGKNRNFYCYLTKAKRHCKITNFKIFVKLVLLSIPGINLAKVHLFFRRFKIKI